MTSGLRPEACERTLLQAGLTRRHRRVSLAEQASVGAGAEAVSDSTKCSSSDPAMLPQWLALQPLV